MSEKYIKNFNGEKIFSLEYDKETLRDMVIDLQDQLQQKENIIKEVREYVELKLWNYFDERNIYLKVRDDFLDILDKENKQ